MIRKKWVAHGLHCRVLAGPFKNYNGYVAVPPHHPAWGKFYMDVYVDVHGGLTFGMFGKFKDREFPKVGLFWPYKWFGFDTSHLGDFIEYSDGSHPEPYGKRWTLDDVIEETERLADQFSEMFGVVNRQ